MNKNGLKLIGIALLILFGMFLQLTTNDIPDYILIGIFTAISGIIGITITPNEKDID